MASRTRHIVPPTIAEAGDPFTAIRVIDLLARLERGTPVRLADIVDRLNATYLDWLFTIPVVADVALQLQVNWMADYRNSSGIVVDDGPLGADARDRGFQPGRSVDRPPGPARGRVVYRAADRVQPPRPTDVGRLRRSPRLTSKTSSATICHSTAGGNDEQQRIRHRERAGRQRLGARPPRRPERTLRRGRRRHDGLRAEPPAGRRRLELDEPAGRRDPARHRRVARTSASSCRNRGSARRRPSSCTATTTTGSPPGRTGSSSCTATRTSGSSTAGASTGSTTAWP